MKTKLAFKPILCGTVTAAVLALSCSSDKVVSPPMEAGAGGGLGAGGSGSGGKAAGGVGGKGSGGAPLTDAGDGGTKALSLCAGKTGQAQLDCGEYIVRHIAACGDCHSPDATPANFLTGNSVEFDIDPAAGIGNIPAPNLTLLKSDGWTAQDVKDALLDGKRSTAHGGGMFPIMPYFTFHNMAGVDADAIAAYILSVTAAGQHMPARETLPPGPPLPVGPVPLDKIPNPTAPAGHQDEAMLGKYIAGQLGLCMDCHTPRIPPGIFDTSRLFAGGESFALPPPLGTVTSLNITPAKNGISGWTPDDVRTLILTGMAKGGAHICPPMPAGPNGAFGGMDPVQALDIGYYLMSIPGIENPADGGALHMCVLPPPPDGGTKSDAGKSSDASTD